MLPTSIRVTLKEAIRPEAFSRRRRATVAAGPGQEVAEAGSVQSGNKAGNSLLAEQVGPEKVTHAARDDLGVEPQKTKGARRFKSCRDPREEGPYTRDNRPSQRSLGGLAGSKGSLRRAVGTLHCTFCGECECVLPHRRASGKRRQRRVSPGLDRSWTEKRFIKACKKNVLWMKPNPKVALCDVSPFCDAHSHKCGFLLTDLLKTKVVRCFKQDMKAGFRLWPGCLGQDKCDGGECPSAKTSTLIPAAQSEENTCRRLNEYEKKISEWPDAETFHSPKCCTAEAPARNDGEYRTSMRFGYSEEENPGAEMRRNKRIRLEHSNNGILSTSPCSTSVRYSEAVKTSSMGRKQTSCWTSNKSAYGSSHVFGSALTEKNVHTEPSSSPIVEPPETDARQILPEVFCEGREVIVDDDPESFTCQRVRAYIGKIIFSCARTHMPWPFSTSGSSLPANASRTTCAADSCPINQSATLSSQTKAPTDPGFDAPNQAPTSKEEKKENGACTSNQRNSCTLLYSPDTTQSEQFLRYQVSNTSGPSTPRQCGSSSTPVNELETNSSIATPSPTSLGLSDWELSSPFTRGGFRSLSTTQSSFLLKKGTGVELADAHSTSVSPSMPWCLLSPLDKLQTSQASRDCAHSSYSESSQSCESSLILPQEEQAMDGNVFSDGSPSNLEPYFKTSPVHYKHNTSTEHFLGVNLGEIMTLPLLSPISSPQRYSERNSLPRGRDCSEKEEVNKDLSKHKILPEYRMPPIGEDSPQSCNEDANHHELEEIMSECTLSTPSSVRDANNGNEEKSQDERDYENNSQQGNSSEQDLLDPKGKGSLASTEPQSYPSSEVDDGEGLSDEGPLPCAAEEQLSLSDKAGHEGDPAEVAGEGGHGVLDEFTAYEQDILLVDVIQDDSELFENVPEQSLLKLGPVRVNKMAKTTPAGLASAHGASVGLKQKSSSVGVNFRWDSSVMTEEQESRPWRPQSSKTPHTRLATDKETRNTCQPDANNNHVSRYLERSQPIQSVNSSQDIVPLMAVRNGSSVANLAEFRRPRSNPYCRKYFSDSLACGFKMCRFQHVPVDGDEKFCVETVARFTKNQMCLQKAGAVFVGYYQNNPPGVHFSRPVLMSLVWALLKAGMVPDVFSILSVCLAHRIVPSYDFLLALFQCVREKSLTGLVPELMQLSAKMASSGLVPSLDGLDCLNNNPELQRTVHPVSPALVQSTSEPFPEYVNLAHSVMDVELCAKQEDWRRMGEVFGSICKFSQHPSQVEQVSGHIAIALLTESKDKLSLPFAVFADTVCQRDGNDGMLRSFLGRIGVSLMLRYHKMHQWAKGRKVVEVLSALKVSYSTLKGLFGNEDGASRCCLITKAAELLLMSGSVEGALNALRENNWFLSSCTWPCEPADLENRTRVLTHLAEKASHRDTLEVLCNLPGIKESSGTMDISRYSPLFNAHLQVCLDKNILPVAADTVDLMLSKNLPVDHTLLQVVLQKLGKQNLWVRAREVFRHSLSVGYYQGVSAPTGFMTLMVPCCLGEVELALTFEMFITVNGAAIHHLSDSSPSSLSITLKRTQSSESEYLSAGSRLLSAGCIPQPNLAVKYKTANASQEQVFTIDICSARRWLRCNHLWANEVWMQ